MSPLQLETKNSDADKSFRAAIKRVDNLIDSGHSFSGSEANCAFLNLGNGTFATVSALSGFDFVDDARSLALVDWDGDGDLDVWVSNRTAPMVRYLRNDSPVNNRSLLLRLEGSEANRNAVGARAELRLKGQTSTPIVRTVKLGEGFLGQSSRLLHFGLGAIGEIDSLRVIWPGGRAEEIKDCKSRTTVAVTEGDTFPHKAEQSSRSVPDQAHPLIANPATLAAAVTLFHPVLFPPLPSIDVTGKPWTVSDNESPVLINLFASWCPDCAAELTTWRDRAAELKAAGVSVALLSADGRDTSHATGPADAWAWLKTNKIPFPAGILTDESFRRLTTAHRQLFGLMVDLPIPTSFLLDGKGRLVAVYRGPVELNRILADCALAREVDPAARTVAALPWAGNWLQVPDPPDPSTWINDFAGRQSWDEASAFLMRHRKELRPHKEFTRIAGALGEKLATAGRHASALAAYDLALEKSDDDADLLNNLANLLVTVPDKTIRDSKRARALAEKATILTERKIPAILDTLAATQAASGDFSAAISTASDALAMAHAAGDKNLTEQLEKAREAYQARRTLQP